jgi:hypothetical protein
VRQDSKEHNIVKSKLCDQALMSIMIPLSNHLVGLDIHFPVLRCNLQRKVKPNRTLCWGYKKDISRRFGALTGERLNAEISSKQHMLL